jgi:hypothetical protein
MWPSTRQLADAVSNKRENIAVVPARRDRTEAFIMLVVEFYGTSRQLLLVLLDHCITSLPPKAHPYNFLGLSVSVANNAKAEQVGNGPAT